MSSQQVKLPRGSQVSVHSNAEAGLLSRPTTAVLSSGDAAVLGKRLVPNVSHHLPPFAVISTIGGADLTITGDGAHHGGSSTFLSAVQAADQQLMPICESIKAARLRYKAAYARQLGAPSTAQQDLPPVPCVLVVGGKGSGKTTLVKQLVNTFVEDMRLGVAADQHDLLAMVNNDISGGTYGGSAMPAAVTCDFIGAEEAQPLTYAFGATAFDTSNYSRYLDVAAYMSQGLDVLRVEAMTTAASRADEAARKRQQGGDEGDEGASADLATSTVTSIVVDTVGIDATNAVTFSVVRELSEIFKATHIVAVAATRPEASALYDQLRQAVTALRAVELMTFVIGGGNDDGARYAISNAIRISRPIKEYFAGTVARPLSAHLQTFAVSDLIFLDAVTFEVVTPSRALQGRVAAVPFPTPMHCIAAASVCGFVIIKEVGATCVSLLCPSKGRLPCSVLMMMGIEAPATLMTSVAF